MKIMGISTNVLSYAESYCQLAMWEGNPTQVLALLPNREGLYCTCRHSKKSYLAMCSSCRQWWMHMPFQLRAAPLALMLYIPAVDACSWGTISLQHDLNAGIFEILEQLDSSTSPAIYVLVPSQGIFDAWIHGMTVPTLPASASDKVKQHCTNLKQYVLYLEAIRPQ